MLGLYCSFVSTVEVDVIPSNEIAFYVFALVSIAGHTRLKVW